MHALEHHPSNPALDAWFVTNGSEAVGPMKFYNLCQELDRGALPANALVRHGSWRVWRRLSDVRALTDAQRAYAVQELARASNEVEWRASQPDAEAPPPPSREVLESPANDANPASFPPAPIDPQAVLEEAQSLEQALLLTLSSSVTAAAAQVAMVHVVRPDLGAVVTSYAHGPNAEQLLGERLPNNDPALLAAQAGHTVVAEFRMGEAGRHIAGRIARVLSGPRGVAMVPIKVAGQLLATLELGRASRPFRAREIARVEDAVEALVRHALAAGWLD